MKQGKRPTVNQRNFMESKELDSNEWLVTKDTPKFMEIAHRELEQLRVYHK